MKIDSHQHFWRYSPSSHAWIDSTMGVLKKDFLPEDLEPLLQNHELDGCVAVQADQSEAETEFLLKCAEEHPFIKGVVGWLDLCAEDIEEKLQEYSKNPLLKGLRHIVQDEPDDYFMLRPEFLRGISLLEKYGLTYDILIFPKHLSSALELVKLFPNQPFVVDHIAKPKINGKIEPCWEHYMNQLGQQDHVYCKASGMVTEAKWGKWSKSDFIPYLDVVFQSFGADRIMFGSDWPVCLLSAEYKQVNCILTQYLTKYPRESRKQVMGLTAQKFYKL
ncbi:amidohydrolase family protein [Flagellimonas olearia]|uniref:Amidohydrolase family protein n=1 Tax=Flagellimonas olearia TaxID=552546 RepID=A0A6I1DVK8_9FLAO|nr:amidohydrolase family protein [Allomuricauda olearia]KAB7529058.1 amidohydrolase family protein [Allomuricauda olearia]